MWEQIADVLIDVIKDSSITFALVLIINILVSFVEGKLSSKIGKKNKLSPLIGAGIGIIPQCGFSVVASDLYIKRRITMGTLVAVFIACSDEAIPIMLSNPDKIIMVFPLIIIKFVTGFVIGFLLDTLLYNPIKKIQDKSFVIKRGKSLKLSFSSQIEPDTCCSSNKIEFKKENKKKEFVKLHLLNPLLHSLKILVYILIINLIFSFSVMLIGEDHISNFLISNVYITPLLSVLVGLIPNCASSIIITELFVQGSITFGAAIGGLICNAGLGFIFILKEKNRWKEGLIILGSVVLTGIIVGYISLFIGFLF